MRPLVTALFVWAMIALALPARADEAALDGGAAPSEPTPESAPASASAPATAPAAATAPAPATAPAATAPPPAEPILAAPAKPLGPMTWVPIEVTLFPPVHVFHPDRKLVGGLSLNVFYGATAAMAGLEAGLVNHEDEWAGGVQVGVLGNEVSGDFGGVEIGGLGNLVRHRFGGLQVATILNAALDDVWGLQLGVANYAQRAPLAPSGGEERAKVVHEATMMGAQLGLANGTENMAGMQVGLWNENDNRVDGVSIGMLAAFAHGKPVDPHAVGRHLDASAGVQIGAFTWARELSGVQIGVVNVARIVRGLQIGLVNIQTRGPVLFFPIGNIGF